MPLVIATLLSLVEGLSQYSLKMAATTGGSIAPGALGYMVVSGLLYTAYRQRYALSTVQVAWSIMSSTLAIVTGVIVFGERVSTHLVPSTFLILANMSMPYGVYKLSEKSLWRRKQP
jgi:uncharacterized membrane protein